MTSPLSPKHLILNMLMAAEGEPLTARDAVGACALFGIRENSVRVALVRLASAGLIESAGRGTYQLGSSAVGLAKDVATWRLAEQRVRAWSGAWIAVHLGGMGRGDRIAWRARDRALSLVGMRELSPGLFIRPDNLVGGVDAARARLLALGLDDSAAVFVAEHFDSQRETRARTLWNGQALNESYRDTRLKLTDWLARADALEPEAAARESFLLGDKAIRQLVYDPLLPAPLVNVDERRAFSDTVIRFDQAGRAIWQHIQFKHPARALQHASRRHH